MPTPLQLDQYYTLYGAEISYFTGKVRPAFLYKHLAFMELLPTAEVYRSVIRARTGFAMIPTVVTPGDDVWQDSSDILDRLEALHPTPPLYPTTPVQRMFAYLVELFTDEFLLLAGVHYRWSYPESASKAVPEFVANTGDARGGTKFAGQVQMFTKMAGVQPETIPHIEANALELFDAMEAHLAVQPYILGGRPSLADCALMGPLYPHFYIDAVPGRILRERYPRVCHWIERMNRPDPRAKGEWLPDDALAPTLAPIAALIGADAIPFVLDQTRAIETYLDTAPVDPAGLPRAIGMHHTALRGVAFERITTPYTLWMVQRLLAEFAALPAAGQAQARSALAASGCAALFDYVPRHRVERRPFQLHVAR